MRFIGVLVVALVVGGVVQRVLMGSRGPRLPFTLLTDRKVSAEAVRHALEAQAAIRNARASGRSGLDELWGSLPPEAKFANVAGLATFAIIVAVAS